MALMTEKHILNNSVYYALLQETYKQVLTNNMYTTLITMKAIMIILPSNIAY